MKFIIRTYKPKNEDSTIYSHTGINNDIEFDTDWFLNTTPSIKDTKLFVPEWEDETNEDTVILFFLAECAKELIEKNAHILSQEAIDALQSFISPNYSTTIERKDDSISPAF